MHILQRTVGARAKQMWHGSMGSKGTTVGGSKVKVVDRYALKLRTADFTEMQLSK